MIKDGPTFKPVYTDLKSKLNEYMGKQITIVEHITRKKNIERKGKLTLLSNNLFVISEKTERHTLDYSYMYGDIEIGRIEIKELANLA